MLVSFSYFFLLRGAMISFLRSCPAIELNREGRLYLEENRRGVTEFACARVESKPPLLLPEVYDCSTALTSKD